MLYRRIAYAVACIAAAMTLALIYTLATDEVEAQRLEGRDLLANLRGYLKVGRVDEASRVLGLLADPNCQSQARYEVARAYVAAGEGEKAIELLDFISLHNRSFDFQRAVLREKVRGLFSFFFDPSGDLRTPAQLDAYVFHSKWNPAEQLRSKDPKGFAGANKLLDYFDCVAKQMEDLLEIQGLERDAEPALAESYDAIQILLYGRGIITHEELADRLLGSPTGGSARTLYLRGNQYFVEADYVLAFETWGRLLREHRESEGALRAFSKAFSLFELRRLLAQRFALWPMDEPVWLKDLAEVEPFRSAAEDARKEFDAHSDLARYKGVTEGEFVAQREIVSVEPDIIEDERAIDDEVVEDWIDAIAYSDPGTVPFVLTRDTSLGWRLQTEFREFLIRRDETAIHTPSAKKTFVVQTSYRGKVSLEARRFKGGDDYLDYRHLEPQKAVEVAASLPIAMEWSEDLGSLGENGENIVCVFEAPIEEPGFYLIAARIRYAPIVATTSMAVVAEKVLTWTTPDEVMYRAILRESGAPVSGGTLKLTITPEYVLSEIAPTFFDGARDEQFISGLSIAFADGERDELTTDNDEFLAGFAEGLKLRAQYQLSPERVEVQTDADGLARAKLPDKWRDVDCRIDAELNSLGRVMPISSKSVKARSTFSLYALLYAERPVFQPGERARVKGIVRRRGPTGTVLPAKEPLEFMLWRTTQLCGVARATPNEVGTVEFEMPLSPNAVNGSYHITIGHDGTKHPVFRIDRTEKPLVDVSVIPDADVVYAGTTVRGKVQVRRAGMMAAAGTPVTVTVLRGDPPAIPEPSDPREDFFTEAKLVRYPDLHGGDAFKALVRGMTQVWTTSGLADGSGEYAFSFASDAAKPARYLVIARVKTLPNRQATATAEVLTSDTPILLEVQPERSFYYPGESLRAQIRTRTLDGKDTPARLEVKVTGSDELGQKIARTQRIETDENGHATLNVTLHTRKPTVKVGVLGTAGWIWREISFSLRQIGASSGGRDIRLSLDKKAYYPGETAQVTVEMDRPARDVMLTLSRDEIRQTKRFEVAGTIGSFKIPITESDAPNVFFHAVSVWDDRVHTASVELPIVPTHKFLSVQIETDKKAYAAGDPVKAKIRVLDHRKKPVKSAEVSLSAVLSGAYVLQEDLTPDLTRYFLNHKLPLRITLGESDLVAGMSCSRNYWLAPTFAWGIYDDLAGNIGVGGGGAGAFGFRSGGGRRRCVMRGGGSRASESMVETFADFLREHGLTLFYDARLITDEKGEAEVDFTLPAGGGEFRFTARAVTADTFVGEIRREVRFLQDVALSVPWPLSIREGERFDVPLFVVNNSLERVTGELSVSSDLQISLEEPDRAIDLAPGELAQRKMVVDARTLPESLVDPETGIFYPSTFASFEAAFRREGGREITSKSMVRVDARGIPVELVDFVLVQSDEGRAVAFDLTKAIGKSARLEVRALPGPASTAQWLTDALDEMATSGNSASCAHAWAVEARAERLSPEEVARGEALMMGAPLVSAYSHDPNSCSSGDAAYFLTVASAKRRGVRLPAGGAERAFAERLRKDETEFAPAELWALAEYCGIKDEKLPWIGKLRSRIRSARKGEPADSSGWAYLALASDAVDRRTEGAWCLEKGLASIFMGRGQRLPDLELEEASALLLAGVRLQLDDSLLGALHGALLESLSREPHPGAWESAVAVHALAAWSEIYRSPTDPVVVTIDGKPFTVEAGGKIVASASAGGRVQVSVPAPESGTLAIEILCGYRIHSRDVQQAKDCAVKRSFARLDGEGNATLMLPGDSLRLGEALMMIVDADGGTGRQLVIPSTGPWPDVRLSNYPQPTKRVLKSFVLSPRARRRVLSAHAEDDIEKVRREILQATMLDDFEEASVGVDDATSGRHRRAHAVKPDRIGSFIAPAAFLELAKGAPPAAAAPPFPFRVVASDEEIPPREAESTIRTSVKAAVADAISVLPADYLAGQVRDATAVVDLRPIAICGVLRSPDPSAGDIYSRLVWGDEDASTDAMYELLEWRNAMFVDNISLTPQVTCLAPEVLRRALGGDDLVVRLAGACMRTDDAADTYDTVRTLMDFENRWRRALWDRARSHGESADASLQLVRLSDVVVKLSPAQASTFFDGIDESVESDEGGLCARGPSLRGAMDEWAERYGLSMNFAADVPDLEAGEFALYLPDPPAIPVLDRHLRGLCLSARRDGLVVSIAIDRNACRLHPEVAAVLSAGDPESRLRAFLGEVKCESGNLFATLTQGVFGGGSSQYTPRVRARSGEAYLADLQIDMYRPLGEQLYYFSAQGVNVDTAGGVLTILPVE